MKVFEKGKSKVIWGDAIEVLKDNIEDSSIDLVFVDPPYNIGKAFNGRKYKWENNEAYLKWCYEWIDLCAAKLKDDL